MIADVDFAFGDVMIIGKNGSYAINAGGNCGRHAGKIKSPPLTDRFRNIEGQCYGAENLV